MRVGLAACLILALAQPAQAEPGLTMGQAIARGMAHDASVLEATTGSDLARVTAREARAGSFPQMRFSVGTGGTNNLTTLLNPAAGGAKTDQNLANLLSASGNAYGISRLSLSQLVLDPEVGTSQDLAELAVLEQELRLKQARLEAGYQAAFAFLAVAIAENRQMLARVGERISALRLAASAYRQTKAQALPGELAQSRQALVEARHARMAADRQFSQDRQALARRLGTDAGVPLATESLVVWSMPGRDAAEAAMLGERLEMALGAIASRRERRAAPADGWVPTLYLGLSVGTVTTSSAAGLTPDVNLTAAANWNLLDGGRNQARREQATLRLANQEAALARTRAELRSELHARYDAFEAAQDALELASEEKVAAARYLEDCQTRLKKGVGTQADEREAALFLEQAEWTLAISRLERIKALGAVRRAMGRDPLAP